MIEVEKKFAPTKRQLKKLLADAEFIQEIIFNDIYFDTLDYSLILKDKWLRLRAGELQLKLPLGPIGHSDETLDLYDEVTDETKIRRILNLSKNGNIRTSLADAGYKLVASFVTTRRKYKKRGYAIDVDEIDFGYNLVEIETLIDDKSKMDQASEKILDFAKSNGLTVTYVRGKFVEYIFRNNKTLYKAMNKAGFFPDA